MDDFKLWPNAHRLARVPVRSFLISLALAICVSGVLAAVVFYFIGQHHFLLGLVGAALTFLEGLVVGLMGARQRALLLTLIRCLEEYRIGASVVRLVFNRLLGVPEHPDEREPRVLAQESTAIMSLPHAERQFTGAVETLRHRPIAGVVLRDMLLSWLQSILLGGIQKYAAARFQKFTRPDGNVDLLGLQTELASCVDRLLIGSMRRRLKLGTLLAMVGYPLQVIILLVLALAVLRVF